MASTSSSKSSIIAIGLVALAGFGALYAILGMGGTTSDVSAMKQSGKTSGITSKTANSETTAPIKLAEAKEAVQSFTDAQRSDIENTVRSYLTKNPEILLEMQAALEKKMEVAQAERTKRAIEANRADLFGGKTSIVSGDPNGDVTVIEFFDYNCGFCKRAIGSMDKLRAGDTKIRFVMKEMPIFGPNSEAAARYAIAARKQGKYWEMHRGLMSLNGQANQRSALRVAENLGLDLDQLKKDAGSRETVEIIRETQSLGRKLGIQGTPHFFVNDNMIAGAPQDLKQQITNLVAKERKKS